MNFSSCLKDTHRKKALYNKTPALIKGMNVDVLVVGTSNQLFTTSAYTETTFWNKVVIGKTPFFVIGPFCTYHSICLNIGFLEGSFV